MIEQGKTYLLIADLITRQQVKSVFPENCYVRSIEELKELLIEDSPVRIIVDLANSKIDISDALALISQQGLTEITTCFYPHIQVNLAEQALQLGFKDLQIRSKFFNNLQAKS